ncbi:MAG: EAL domain-containing protein [Erysipelotrichia bacterium]|nr:EAL domain-containing protein [Erysipelotrichia bacterium]
MISIFVADSLKKSFEETDSVCGRIMADNFSALIPLDFMPSQKFAQIRQMSAKLDGSILPIALSIGWYKVDDTSLSASAMYDRAMLAEESVKGRYDCNIAQFDESMRQSLLTEQEVVSEMKQALELGQFEPWFQPQYNHATGKLIGAEVLVRWRHPKKGMIPPSQFIPLFEKNGFIYDLDKYIWKETCRCLQKWIKEGRNPLPVSINISRYDIFRDDLIDVISGLITQYNVPADLLRLEITESAFSISIKQIVSVVKKLVEKGFTIEIDDFGSGYSSLNTLKDVPAQIIKLDMKFMENSDDNQRGGNIVESMVRMAKWLDMAIIAEGVETRNQADFLKSIGCFYVQGYLYARPMPLADFEALTESSGKQQDISTLETVDNLDSNAFWNPDSMDTLIFNNYLGGACIYEYYNDRIELLRANDKYIQVLGSVGMTIEDALKLNWSEYLCDCSREQLNEALKKSAEEKTEACAELIFVGLPGCTAKTYLHSTLRVIAKAGDRLLIYCYNENITAQRLSEQKREETSQ